MSELELVENYKYLGLILDENFTWKNHLEKMLEKARKRTRALCAMGLREGVQILVRPVLEYGAEIWGENLEAGRVVTDGNGEEGVGSE